MQARIFAERIQNALASGVKYEEDKRNAAIATECGHRANQRFSAPVFSLVAFRTVFEIGLAGGTTPFQRS